MCITYGPAIPLADIDKNMHSSNVYNLKKKTPGNKEPKRMKKYIMDSSEDEIPSINGKKR